MHITTYRIFRHIFKTRNLQARKMTTALPNTESQVFLTVENNKGIITLNRPKALNSLNLSMINQIYPTLNKWNDAKLDMVIIEGAGDKAFCAGGDVVAITTTSSEKRGTELQTEFFKKEYQLNHLIGTLRIPYIALIDGITMGGGVGLSVHGKYRVATEKTTFAMPETGIGLFPDVGGSFFMPKLKGGLGMYLALTGFRLKGADCVHAGIATHICKQEDIKKLKAELLRLDSCDDSDILELLNHYDAQFSKEKFCLEEKLPFINECFTKNSVESILECLQNSNEGWSKKTADGFKKLSPTSVKVTFEQMSRGKDYSTLKECLQMEYRLACRCCEDIDFYEGIRALLIDKDNNPKWHPNTLKDVTQDILDKYFSELPNDRELRL